MIYINKHPTEKGEILAMCDEELIGKTFSEGKRELDLKRYASFYKGKLVSSAEAKAEVNAEMYSANVVGKDSIAILIAKKIIKKSDVGTIQGVEFVQIFSTDK